MTVGAWRASLAALLLAVLAGCVDAPVAATPPPASGAAVPATPVPAPAPPAADVAAADADLARMMIPHHEQALELSALADGRASSPDVVDLAFRIDREQVEEVGQLQGFLRLRGERVDGGAMAGMAGMADATTLRRLRTSTGPPFDRLWLATMTAHHEGALAMARDHLAATGGTGSLAEFSRTLLVSQQAEIDRMAQVAAR